MTTPQQWDNLIGLTAIDSDGDQIGKVGQVYLDDAAGQPEWVTVSTGMFGTRESFAPLASASVRDGQLVLAVPKQLVKDAPNIDDDGHLADTEVAAHLDPASGRGTRDTDDGGYPVRHAGEDVTSAAGDDTSGPVTDDAMTRSEERLHVGTKACRPARRGCASTS